MKILRKINLSSITYKFRFRLKMPDQATALEFSANLCGPLTFGKILLFC